MILHNFTHKCTTLIRTSLTKFADRFFRKRSTSISVGPLQPVCTSLVCGLSVLYIVLFLLAAAETSLLPPSQNAIILLYLNADDTMRLEGFSLLLWPEIYPVSQTSNDRRKSQNVSISGFLFHYRQMLSRTN